MNFKVIVASLLAIGLAPGRADAAAAYTFEWIGLDRDEAYAFDVNNHGEVVGMYSSPVGQSAFYYSNGSFADIGAQIGAGSYAWSINDKSVSVGFVQLSFTDPQVSQHAAVWAGKTGRDIGGMSEPYAYARGINEEGLIVGYGSVAGGSIRGFTYESGIYTALSTLGGANSAALAVNASGQIVGSSYRSSDTYWSRPVMWKDGQIVDLLGSGDGYGEAFAINDNGTVLGSIHFGGASRSVVFRDGSYSYLSTLGGAQGVARAINNVGEMVGTSQRSDGSNAGTLWKNDVAYDLSSLVDLPAEALSLVPLSMNDRGQIAGFSDVANSLTRGFLLTPVATTAVPEPASWAMMLLGFGLIGCSIRRRSKVNIALIA